MKSTTKINFNFYFKNGYLSAFLHRQTLKTIEKKIKWIKEGKPLNTTLILFTVFRTY